ncbi:hypothetical protein SOCEGT47_029520 [Sorangium cellulosum]|uniref:Protein kinase domain-containing protein n=2 Tax=Sorangium cellulosum TaxID=56 RepID=A0A4P2PZW0_SORCE|nr:hypothetical protein SOCEGT47_029520 [Sorangium cellulosum]
MGGGNGKKRPHALGPYRLLDRIGGGGMGVVFRAEHVETGAKAAIKTARCATDPEHVAALRLEIETLRRLRHPDIVRLLDADIADGVPWIAMPLLEGRTLCAHLQAPHPTSGNPRLAATIVAHPAGHAAAADADRRREAIAAAAAARPLGPTLTLIRRLCAPLAYLHGEGFVHRDLKPSNIFLQGDGRPVLLDLGIAAHFGGAGREELGATSHGGTPHYMAPEQIQQGIVDGRADLYALGCLLYECVTGRPPFVGGARSVLEQHVIEPPLRPSIFVPDLPAGLEDLILALLEKDAKDRIQYAVDVATRLVALGAAPEPWPEPRPRPYLYRPVFAGRADVLAMMVEMVRHAALRRRGGIALVLGESGSGKTRLARELPRLARDQHHRAMGQHLPLTVLTGSCVAPGAGEAAAAAAMAAPLHPLRPALLAALAQALTSTSEAARLFGGNLGALATFVPELGVLADHHGQPAPAPPLPPSQARKRLVSAVLETLRALAQPMPLLLFLDDLQWADDLTLAVLDALAKAEPDERAGVLVVATCRIEEMRDEIESLMRSSSVTPIQLGKLTPRDIDAMVAGMLSSIRPPQSVLDALIHNANGNPFFVAEFLRAALDEGILRRDEDGQLSFSQQGADPPFALPMPRALDELLARRLDLLDAEARALASWAAVLGHDLGDARLLVAPGGEDAAAEPLRELRARRILEETETGELRFVHDQLREMAYRRLDDGTRAALHRRAGEAIEALYGEAPEVAHVLGRHFAGAGLHDRAGVAFERAAARAVAVYAYRDAVRLLRSAIDALTNAGATPERLARLNERLGDVLALLGWQEMARHAYSAALSATPSPIDAAELHRKIGKTWEMRHEHAEALESYAQAEAALRAPPEPASSDAEAWSHAWIQLHLDRISVCYWLADREGLGALIEAVRPAIAAHGNALQRAHYLHALTQQGILRDRFAASVDTVGYATACVAAYEAAGEAPDGHWVLSARVSLGIILLLGDELDRADTELSEALWIARPSGDLEIQTRCLTYLSLIQRKRGLVDAARHWAEQSLKLAKAENVREYAGAALANLSWCALRRGDLARAEEAGREALALWNALPLVYPFEWLARLPLCWIALERGRLDGAIAEARAVLDPRQQRLPGRLAALLGHALRAFDDGRVRAFRTLKLALRGARHRNYA